MTESLNTPSPEEILLEKVAAARPDLPLPASPRIRRTPLAFLVDWDLYALEGLYGSEPVTRYFLSDGETVLFLDGSGAPVRAILAEKPPYLSPRTTPEYVRFFCTYCPDAPESLPLVEAPDILSAPLPEGVKVAPLARARFEEGRWKTDGTALIDGDLWAVTACVAEEGTLSFEQREKLLARAPLILEEVG